MKNIYASQKEKRLNRLATQWWRVHLTVQGPWAGSLVQEFSTCFGATATTAEPGWGSSLF